MTAPTPLDAGEQETRTEFLWRKIEENGLSWAVNQITSMDAQLAERERELKQAIDEKDYWVKNHSQQVEDENYDLRQQLEAIRKQTVDDRSFECKQYRLEQQQKP